MKILFMTIVGPLLSFVAIALLLIVTQSPRPGTGNAGKAGLDFSSAIEADYSTLPDFQLFPTRSVQSLPYRHYPGADERGPSIILLHGSGWHGMQFHSLARALGEDGAFEVIVPDIRGHGYNPQRRGDVDHIGQLEEEIADLIAHLRASDISSRKIIVGGIHRAADWQSDLPAERMAVWHRDTFCWRHS
ncbi:MAG: alpha/beta fold hydrolase [Rhizobiaceae bacterium]